MPPKDYDDKYIEACFFAWYRAGAPGLKNANGSMSVGGTRVIESLPPDADGKKPSHHTLVRWIEIYGWRTRADALDAQVSIQLEKEVIEERINTLKQLAQDGKTLKQKGLDFINKNTDPFSANPSAAVRAIVAGSEMEFKYAGAADRLAAISQMPDSQIEKEILHLLGKESNENEDIVEAQSEDIPTSEDDDNAESNDS